jgi:hypothetical protein
MRNKQSYVKEYGPKAGPLIFKLLQKEAAHAKWKAEYLKKFKALKAKVS